MGIRLTSTHSEIRKCKICKTKHIKNKHRFHGRCSFKKTHKGYCNKHKCGCEKAKKKK